MNDWEKDFHETIVLRMDKSMKVFVRAIEQGNYDMAFAACTLLRERAGEAKAKLRAGQRQFDWSNTGMDYKNV